MLKFPWFVPPCLSPLVPSALSKMTHDHDFEEGHDGAVTVVLSKREGGEQEHRVKRDISAGKKKNDEVFVIFLTRTFHLQSPCRSLKAPTWRRSMHTVSACENRTRSSSVLR